MSTTFYIIDDEAASIVSLARVAESIEDLTLSGSSTDPIAALWEFKDAKIQADITFLDIDMPKISGLDLAPLLMPFTTVIFVTAHPDFAPQSYDLGIVDFIIKPVSLRRLEMAVKRAGKEVQERKAKLIGSDDFIYLFTERKRKRIKLLFDETFYLESESNNVKVVTEQEVIRIHDSMDNMEHQLPGTTFMRVHRSFIINIDKITAYEDGMVTIAKKFPVPIGRKFKKLFLERMGF